MIDSHQHNILLTRELVTEQREHAGSVGKAPAMYIDHHWASAAQLRSQYVKHQAILAIGLLREFHPVRPPAAEVFPNYRIQENIARPLHASRSSHRRIPHSAPLRRFRGRQESRRTFSGTAVRDSAKDVHTFHGDAA